MNRQATHGAARKGEMTFDELVKACTGFEPYDYQRRIAAEGLPELLVAPTAAGKTQAVVLGWLYRRHFHPDPLVRASTPRWLVVCEPMRTLVEQVRNNVKKWIEKVEAAEPAFAKKVNFFVFMGGEPTEKNDWRLNAEADAIIIGTQDMLLSRALNRGFGSSRNLWPVEFGMLNNGCAWVFDEIQLMGPGLPTGRQLEAFRKNSPALLPHSSTWMSATVDAGALSTVDNRTIPEPLELSAEDRSGPLARRLNAAKTARELMLDPKKRDVELAANVTEKHRPGTLTLVILNTVADAQAVHAALLKRKVTAELTLLHSRFRRADRKRLVQELTSSLPAEGRICVSTQVVEAGMDLDAALLFTEAAPWASIVQRLGRCNRAGAIENAEMWWFPPVKPDKPVPYEANEIEAAIASLRSFEGQSLKADGLAALGPEPIRKLVPVLRRRDLENLFDTAPEIEGADIDVSPFVRDADERTVSVAWMELPGTAKDRNRFDVKRPSQAELCPAPLGKDLSDWVSKNNVYAYDVSNRHWIRARATELRPNLLLVTEPLTGGYTAERGWDPKSTAAVPSVVDDDADTHEVAEFEEGVDDDSASYNQQLWVTLSTHLLDTERAAERIAKAIGLTDDLTLVSLTAGRLHDIGKAHPIFQDTMRRGAEEAGWIHFDASAPLAKSRGRQRHRNAEGKRTTFRHELASALALLGEARPALDHLPEEHRFLCVYLIAAHHGRIRMSLRSLPGEPPDVVFGVRNGDVLPSVSIGALTVLASEIAPTQLLTIGTDESGVIPWRDRTEELRSRFGVFGLSLLESVVRLADWKASSAPSDEGLPQ
jgi:CRISPR-associated endonuclease/helicase Cas3